ncbi:hypothetical protein B0H11DRAFT_2058636 [Mycena galericulata]|nr:hypothetical protein B0H11DRAFT_2058636 [Mycena galericulata]
MSDLSDAQIYHQLFISRCLVFIPFTILLYDYALTIGLEVERYWGTTLTWGGGLYYLNRYSALIGTIPVFVEYLLTTDDPGKDSVCDGFQSYHQYFALLSQLLVAVILITRTYALYEQNKIVLGFMVVITLGATGFGVAMALTGSTSDTLPQRLQSIGCPSPTDHSSNLRTAAAWSGMLVFDVMIFALTMFKARRYSTRRGSLFTVLVRDGGLYFAVIIASNACNIGTYVLSGPILSGALSTVTNVLSSVLVSRLMLNLRDPTIRLPQRNRSARVTTATTRESFASRRRARPDLTDIALELDTVSEDQTHWMDGED